jgi:hypothetical protein
MAKIKTEEIVTDLGFQFRKAVVQAVQETLPGAQFDEMELFRAFKKALRRKCNPWEVVNDAYVER